MKNKLYQLLIIFLTSWTIGQFCNVPHNQNVIYTIFCTIAGAIWLGLYFDLKALIFKKS